MTLNSFGKSAGILSHSTNGATVRGAGRPLSASAARRIPGKPGIGRNHPFATFLSSTWFMIFDHPRDSAPDSPRSPRLAGGRCWFGRPASQRVTSAMWLCAGAADAGDP